MSLMEYFKERWITYLIIFFSVGFSMVVYKLDKSFSISESNANYIMIGWLILFTVFVLLDYSILNNRLKKFSRFCKLNAPSECLEEFTYRTDKAYAQMINNLVVEHEKFKANIFTKTSDELEFITRWVHDVKVPISAARLILENNEYQLPNEVYQSIDTEIFAIEESIQRVFYETKSNRFYDDYKVGRVSTKKLISDTLKGYANFFSYKKINISITGEAEEVLTDEKWSGYILSQIISNAVKYTPIKGTIKINTSKLENETTISIENNGKGIMEKDIGQIFNKGYTSWENRNGMKATGYGLYLSKKLCDSLGHKLTVQSEYGKFAVFSITFIDNETLHQVTKM